MQTTDFYSSATGTLQVKGGRDENAPQGVSLSIDDLSYIKQGSRVNEGSPGTSDYNDLSNKPSINSVELKGNKSLNDLGIQPKIDSSHKVSADNIDDANTTNKFATAAQLEQITTNQNNISLKQDALKIIDLKGTTKIDLSTLTWTQSYGTSGNGLYYTTIGPVTGISSIYCITIIGFGGIDATSFFIPRTTNDGAGLMLMANNDFSTQTQAYIELRIVGV